MWELINHFGPDWRGNIVIVVLLVVCFFIAVAGEKATWGLAMLPLIIVGIGIALGAIYGF